MKKFMVFACAVLSSAAMQAQDIKTILGAEKYTDALELIKQGGGNLSNEDKAKAYNKVVDLALAKYNKEAYYKMRSDFNNDKDDMMLLYMLLIYGFNRMLRFNSKGDFNLPVGNVDFNKNVVK